MNGRSGTHEAMPSDSPVPRLICPDCDRPLQYQQTFFGGVKREERWDQFVCRPCAISYEYRHRTRRLRRDTLPASDF